MSLHEKVLPPSLNFRTPNPNIDWASSPFAVNTELRDFPAGASGARVGGRQRVRLRRDELPRRPRGVRARPAPDRRAAFLCGRRRPAGEHRSRSGSGRCGGTVAGTAAGTVAGVPAAPVASSSKAPLRGALVVGAASDSDLARRLADVVESAASVAAKPPAAPAAADLRAPVRVAIDYGDAAELADKAGRALKAVQSGQPAAWKMLRSRGVFFGRGAGPEDRIPLHGPGIAVRQHAQGAVRSRTHRGGHVR